MTHDLFVKVKGHALFFLSRDQDKNTQSLFIVQQKTMYNYYEGIENINIHKTNKNLEYTLGLKY
jgi:hypothetical protein